MSRLDISVTAVRKTAQPFTGSRAHSENQMNTSFLNICRRSLVFLFVSASALEAATFTVNRTDDAGAGSLRETIIQANAAPNENTIDFAVTGTITLASPLPAIASNTKIIGPGTNLLTISG